MLVFPIVQKQESGLKLMTNSIAEEFKINLMEDGKNPKTIESNVGDVSAFVSCLGTKGVDFTEKMKRFCLTSYRNYLKENQYELTTVNKKFNSIRSFSRYLLEKIAPEIKPQKN